MQWSRTGGTTILPGSGRPTDCLGGSVRQRGARFTKINDDQYLKSHNERNDNGYGFSNDLRNDFSNGARDSKGLRLRLRLR